MTGALNIFETTKKYNFANRIYSSIGIGWVLLNIGCAVIRLLVVVYAVLVVKEHGKRSSAVVDQVLSLNHI